MHPYDPDDVRTIEELGGEGFSPFTHHDSAARVHAAAQLLIDARDGGLQLDRAKLRTDWDLTTSASELSSLYGEESTLELGD